MPNYLHTIASTPAKDKNLARQNIRRQHRLDQCTQAVQPAPHISHTRDQPDPYPCRYAQHGRTSSRITARMVSGEPPQIFKRGPWGNSISIRSEEHTSELQSH